MKKLSLILIAVSTAFAANAQGLNVSEGSVVYSFSAEQTGVMEYSNGGKTITIQGKSFDLSEAVKIKYVPEVTDDNTVTVEYDGTAATVSIAGNIARYITATVDGAHVAIEQDKAVGDDTGEITYILSGKSDNGSLLFAGSYKATIEMHGLTLTNPSGAAINIDNGKRIGLSSKSGFENFITDGKDSGDKAAIYCKGHLELKGKGTLNVTGKKSHAIAAKEYIEMQNCTVNILGSSKDGINCTQHFTIKSGTLNISGVGEDGIQVDYKDSSNPDSDDTGTITINGGSVNIAISGAAAKALKSEGNFVMTGGELVAESSSPGEWDSSKSKVKASACIGADEDVLISDGTLNLTATGGGGKGITCDGDFTFDGGNLTITTSGGVLAYVGNSLNQNYTGNTDSLKSDLKSSPKGVKADGKVEINGGDIFVTTSGKGGEGIESKSTLTVNEGNVKVRAKDDAINSSNHMYIKGGVIDVISTGNDGLDSNGSIYISGGLVMAFGSSAPECGLDANSEEGFTVYFTGGYILAAGGGNSVPTKQGSSQPFVNVNATVNADTEVSIGTSSSTIYTFKTPADLTNVNLGGSSGNRPGGMGQGGSSLLISVPGLTSGTSYTVKSGSSSTTGTAALTGSSTGPGGRP